MKEITIKDSKPILSDERKRRGMRKDVSWRAVVLTAWFVVSLIILVMAAVRACGKEPARDNPSVATCSDATSSALRAPSPQVEGKREAWEDEVLAQIEAQMIPPERKYVGRCRLTVYNASESRYGYRTATGVHSQHLTTCAVDPAVIPYGSTVIVIDNDGEEWRFKAVDCGGFSGKWVDIFFDGSELGGIYWLDEVFGGEFAEVYVEAAG